MKVESFRWFYLSIGWKMATELLVTRCSVQIDGRTRSLIVIIYQIFQVQNIVLDFQDWALSAEFIL